MSLRCLIIDDEPLAHRVIRKYAEGLPGLEITGSCHLATEALPFLRDTPVDLIFLDVNMPRISGLDFLRSLRHPPPIIITSAHEEYALEGYDLDVVDYLLKPFSFERFLRAVTKVMVNESPGTPAEKTHLFVKSDKRTVSIAIDTISHLESYGNYVKLYQGETYLLTPATLSGLTASLPGGSFFRIHKSYTVNWQFIDYLEGNELVLKNGRRLAVGKSYRAGLKEFLKR